jgi:ABC-type lipoprotein export system ATPase subunit
MLLRWPPLTEPLIDLRGVVKSFRGPAGTFTALKGIDLRIDAGEFVAVIGKSGSGKSTLINMVAGIDRPSAGEVFVGGVAVHRLDERRLARWRGRTIGIVFQFFQLLPTLTLLENVMLPMDFCRVGSPSKRAARAMRLLDMVGLAAHADKMPQAVSGGQQQRAAIARALANNPSILIADEPTGNLDSRTAEQVFDLFRRLVAHGKTVLMVTHDDDFAHRVSRAVIVADGEVVNQYVAQALSTLDLDQMTLAQSHLRPQSYPAGAVIFRQGDPADRFYVVTRGSVEVVIERGGAQPVVVNRLGAGRYFGEVGLLVGGQRTATVRSSSDEGVDLMALDAETFRTLLADSEPTRESIERVLGQYIAARPEPPGGG